MTQNGHRKVLIGVSRNPRYVLFMACSISSAENEGPTASETCYLRRDHKRDYGMVVNLRSPSARFRPQYSSVQAWSSSIQKRCESPITAQLLSLQRPRPPSVHPLRNLLQCLQPSDRKSTRLNSTH